MIKKIFIKIIKIIGATYIIGVFVSLTIFSLLSIPSIHRKVFDESKPINTSSSPIIFCHSCIKNENCSKKHPFCSP